ncbi:hypothetical protein CEUSTIGMA_g2067.t1, partial [Chlamydomonas eustigma]
QDLGLVHLLYSMRLQCTLILPMSLMCNASSTSSMVLLALYLLYPLWVGHCLCNVLVLQHLYWKPDNRAVRHPVTITTSSCCNSWVNFLIQRHDLELNYV